MNVRHWVCLIAVCAQAMALQVQPATDAAAFSREDIEALQALTPEQPERYLELGEEILDRPDSPQRVEMARNLFVRAVEYGRLRPGGERVAASAALALASMSPRAAERRWLRAVASTLHPDYAAPAGSERPDPAAGARAAELITRLRAGEGIRPREIIGDAKVRGELVRGEAALSADGTIGLTDLDAAAKKQPCPTCSGRGIAVQQGPKSAALCPVCKGRTALNASIDDVASQLRLQLSLMGERQDQWGKVTESETAPARDPDASEVAVVFGIDTKLSVWRSGQWATPQKTVQGEQTPTVVPAP